MPPIIVTLVRGPTIVPVSSPSIHDDFRTLIACFILYWMHSDILEEIVLLVPSATVILAMASLEVSLAVEVL